MSAGSAAAESLRRAVLVGPERSRWNDRLALLALGCLFLTGSKSFVDPDIFHCLSLARESIASGRLLSEDVFAYTPTVSTVVHHEWLHGFILYSLVSTGGAAALLAWKHVLVAGMAIAAFSLARRRGAGPGTIAILAPPAVLLAWIGTTTVRAQVLTLVFTGILLHLLESDRRGRKLWVLPWLGLHLLWLNVHGGFVVGCALVVLHGIEQALRRRPVGHIVLGGLAALLLVAANPFGIDYFPYIAKAIVLDRSSIGEWAPIWKAFPPVMLVWGISVVIAAYGVARVGPARAEGALLLAGAVCASFLHQRHVSIHALVWMGLVPSLIEATPLGAAFRSFQRKAAATWLWSAGLAGALALCLLVAKPWTLEVPAHPGDHDKVLYPSGAIAYLREQGFHGNMLVPFVEGAYVSWKLYPALRVSIDGRYEAAYPPRLLEEHIAFYDGHPGWRELLDRYPTDLALIPRRRPVAPLMRARSGWTRVYEDDAYEVYARPGIDLPRVDRRGQHLTGEFP